MPDTTPTFLTPPFSTPLTRALAALRARGHTVEPQDVPGLYRIDGGLELTMGQVVHVAQQMGALSHAG